MLQHKKIDKTGLKLQIKNELQNDWYKAEFQGLNGSKIDLFYAGEVEKIADEIWKIYNSQKMKFRIKKFVSKVLN